MLPSACSLGQHFQVRSHSFSQCGPTLNQYTVNKLFIFSKLSNEKKLTEKTHASITVTMVDRKSRTVLRTNQIAGFVTMPDWKKIKHDIFTCEDIMFLHENPPGISNFNFRHS